MSSGVKSSTFEISCEVRKPSKKWRNGTRDSKVAAWAIKGKSIASWIELEASKAKPVDLVAITSLCSPNMESAWQATERAETLNTVAVSSPAILNILGSINKRPWEAVKVVVRAPLCKDPWTAPEAPPSLCISVTWGIVPQILGFPSAAQRSASSPMDEEGVIGYMVATSFRWYAVWAAAVFPSIVTFFLFIILVSSIF